MRYVYSLLAVLACVVVILARDFHWPGVVIVVGLIVAAAFLALALFRGDQDRPGKDRPLRQADFSPEREDEIRELVSAGKYGTAVKQVRLWYRHVGHDEAEAMVSQLTTGR